MGVVSSARFSLHLQKDFIMKPILVFTLLATIIWCFAVVESSKPKKCRFGKPKGTWKGPKWDQCDEKHNIHCRAEKECKDICRQCPNTRKTIGGVIGESGCYYHFFGIENYSFKGKCNKETTKKTMKLNTKKSKKKGCAAEYDITVPCGKRKTWERKLKWKAECEKKKKGKSKKIIKACIRSKHFGQRATILSNGMHHC